MNDFTSTDKTNLETDLNIILGFISEDSGDYKDFQNDIIELRDNLIQKGKPVFYSQVHNLFIKHFKIIPNNNTLLKVKAAVFDIWNRLLLEEKFNIVNPTGTHMMYPIYEPMRVDILGLIKGRIDAAVAHGRLKECGNLSSIINTGVHTIKYASDNEDTDLIFEVSIRDDKVVMKFFIDLPNYHNLKQIVIETIQHNVL